MLEFPPLHLEVHLAPLEGTISPVCHPGVRVRREEKRSRVKENAKEVRQKERGGVSEAKEFFKVLATLTR